MAGVNVIAVDLIDSRLQLARNLGAKWLCNPYAIPEDTTIDDQNLPQLVGKVTRGRGLDAAVIAVPKDDVVRAA